jgi:PPOX class probable FMN-dependent enzyme
MREIFGLSVDRHIQSSSDLRDVAKKPSHYVDNKVIDHIDTLSQRFIAASSLAIVSSIRPDGVLDLTPRGDPPGFVRVLNRKLIAIPDRPGNNRMDTFENVLENQNVGILFIIPGHRDTLRVSGKGAVVRDSKLAQETAINGRPADLILLLKVERVLSHCPKAFVRGKVWQPNEWPDTADVPTLAEMLVAHGNMSETVAEVDAAVRKDGETRLY